jgi:hypothetical protein
MKDQLKKSFIVGQIELCATFSVKASFLKKKVTKNSRPKNGYSLRS